MRDLAISISTWVFVTVFDVVLLYGVHYREKQTSVFEHSAQTAGAIAAVLAWSIVLFSVYTWGFTNVFMHEMLLAAVVSRDARLWNTSTDHLCGILFFCGLQAVLCALIGAYAAAEGDVYAVLCTLGVNGGRRQQTVLYVLCAGLAVCSVATTGLAVHLMQSGVERPNVPPWDVALVLGQAVMFVLACVLAMSTRMRTAPRATAPLSFHEPMYAFVC